MFDCNILIAPKGYWGRVQGIMIISPQVSGPRGWDAAIDPHTLRIN